MRKLAVMVVATAALFVAPSAQAAIDDVFDGTIACVKQTGGATDGQRWCGTGIHNPSAQNPPVNTRSTVESFDGVPIDVNVAFPDEDEYGDGPFPLVYMFHGYGGGKINFNQMQRWLNKGYAVFSQSNRGFHESCGTANAKAAASPICADEGYVRLNDTRYEVRDAQTFAGMLVDENRVLPNRIAATGGSYGGGMSMALAALKDRIMLPDGSYDDWESPNGTAMSLAVAIPNVPWTDLAYSLVPNGHNIDYIEDASYFGRFGVMKQSYVNGLYLSGLGAPGYYLPAGQDPAADLAGWKAFMDAGEPYAGAQADQMLEEITSHHSSYYIDHSQAPAPLLISSGFIDDLFPAGEATRFYNRTKAEFPSTPLGLFFGPFGHMRGQSKSNVSNALTALENQWVDYYLADEGTQPASNVTTFTQTCPNNAAAAGPFVTGNWAAQSPGEIREVFGGKAQVIEPDGGDRAVGTLFNPAPSGQGCPETEGEPTPAAGAQEPGIANYEFDPAPAGGFTVMGATTVIAYIKQAGTNSQLAARLVDVSPDGTSKRLVNRGIWRPDAPGYQVFQLQSNGWKVEEGHVLRLEVLPFDGGSADPVAGLLANYGRPSNGQQPAAIANLDVRVPVQEAPGSLGGFVTAPAAKVLPDRPGVELSADYTAIGSQTLAAFAAAAGDPDLGCPPNTTGSLPDCEPINCPDFTTGEFEPDCQPIPCPEGTTGPAQPDCQPIPNPVIGKIKVVGATVKGKVLTARVSCAAANDSCAKAKVQFKGAPKKGKGKGVVLATKTGVTAGAGKTVSVKFNLTAKARKLFKDTRKRVRVRGKVRVVKVKGLKQLRARILIAGKASGFVNVKRNGKVK